MEFVFVLTPTLSLALSVGLWPSSVPIPVPDPTRRPVTRAYLVQFLNYFSFFPLFMFGTTFFGVTLNGGVDPVRVRVRVRPAMLGHGSANYKVVRSPGMLEDGSAKVVYSALARR